MASKLIISKDARFMGKTLEEMAKEKVVQKTTSPANNFRKQNVLPGQISTLAEYDNNKGMTQEQAVKAANDQKLIIASNLWADEDLNVKDGYNKRNSTCPIWTGTLVAYEKPGIEFGDMLTYTDSETKISYTFQVPKQYQGKTNCILAIDHGFLADGTPVFEHVQSGGNILIKVADESLIKLIKNYNQADGWYLPEKDFGIPLGRTVDSKDPNARYSYRLNDSTYVGLVARGDYFGGRLRDVVAVDWPSVRLGVLAYSEQV